MDEYSERENIFVVSYSVNFYWSSFRKNFILISVFFIFVQDSMLIYYSGEIFQPKQRDSLH